MFDYITSIDAIDSKLNIGLVHECKGKVKVHLLEQGIDPNGSALVVAVALFVAGAQCCIGENVELVACVLKAREHR